MPILPLEPEPFAATLGIMLYPGEDESDRGKARAFASHYLAKPIRKFVEDGGSLNQESLLKLTTSGGERLDDLEKRWREGLWAGEILKAYFILSWNTPKQASWEKAIGYAVDAASIAKVSGVRSSFKKAQKQFETVAHLWGAWAIREGKFTHDPETGYEARIDFQAFLAESEILRDWGQNWKPGYAKAKTPLPANVWRVPDDWHPPKREDGWPQIGVIPHMTFDEEYFGRLKPKDKQG